MQKLKDMLLGNRFVGLELHSTADGLSMHGVKVHKEKGELNLVGTFDGNPSELKKKGDFGSTVIVAVNTKEILHKQVPDAALTDQNALLKAFPNIAYSEFYFDVGRFGNTCIVALARKTYVDNLVSEYIPQSIKLAGLRLGICSLDTLFGSADRSRIQTNSQHISLAPDFLIEPYFTTEKKDFETNGIVLNNTQLVAFSVVVKTLLDGASASDLNRGLMDRFLQKRFFVLASRTAIGFFLFLLLINFFVFSHYFKQNESLKEQNAIDKDLTKNLAETRERVLKKNERLAAINGNINVRLSKIIDNMMRAMPHSITLDKMAYNPVLKKIKPEEQIQYQDKQVVINGIAKNNLDFTKWVAHLKSLSEVSAVAIVNYGQDQALETSFELRIDLK